MATYYTNAQRYSIHDGAGIRTTVFFKGCPLRCAWCHNPENLDYAPQLMFYADRCVGCGACAAAYPQVIHMENGRPVIDRAADAAVNPDICRQDALERVGRQADIDEIVAVCLRDLPFYEQSGGGVTLSGGEVMAQDPAFLAQLVGRLKGEGLSVFIDTSGHAPWPGFQAVLPYTDTFLYDLKHMDSARHRQLTGVDNGLILDNLERLARHGAAIHLRLPLIAGVNDGDGDADAIIAWLMAHGVRPVKISLLPYHNTYRGKLIRLGRDAEPDTLATPDPARMEALAARFRDAGLGPVSIGA